MLEVNLIPGPGVYPCLISKSYTRPKSLILTSTRKAQPPSLPQRTASAPNCLHTVSRSLAAFTLCPFSVIADGQAARPPWPSHVGAIVTITKLTKSGLASSVLMTVAPPSIITLLMPSAFNAFSTSSHLIVPSLLSSITSLLARPLPPALRLTTHGFLPFFSSASFPTADPSTSHRPLGSTMIGLG